MKANELLFIINTYGTKMQEDIALEELAELQKAILKHRRYGNKETEKEIIDEIADVEIMLEQLKIIYSCSNDVEKRVEYKIEREINRIKNKHNIADKETQSNLYYKRFNEVT